MLLLLALLPWLAFLVWLVGVVRLPRPLPGLKSSVGSPVPLRRVSVIVPARNEVRNIEKVLSSLAASDYPDFEIVVVDDRSDDGTAELARAVDPGNADAIHIVEGEELPAGWLGKPWACHQGALAASGDLLLFTDADTWHGPQLLRRAVVALQQDDAHMLSVAGRQLMLSFWERMVQPQVFTGMLFRYPRQQQPVTPERWRDAIANGQFILVPRHVYAREGGHAAVRGEVVEDMRMAQRWARAGRRVSVRMAEDAFSTRMYASLDEILEGWTKNIVLGGMATLEKGWVRRASPVVALVLAGLVWLVPPIVFIASLLGLVTGFAATWATGAVVLSVVTWGLIKWRMGAPAALGLLYPLGVVVLMRIMWRAWRQEGQVAWKGREYRLDPDAVMGDPLARGAEGGPTAEELTALYRRDTGGERRPPDDGAQGGLPLEDFPPA
jgi:chlorobactene glucosyltransferase